MTKFEIPELFEDMDEGSKATVKAEVEKYEDIDEGSKVATKAEVEQLVASSENENVSNIFLF